MCTSKRLADFKEQVRLSKIKKKLKSAFKRKQRPAKVIIKDDISPTGHCKRTLLDAAQKSDKKE